MCKRVLRAVGDREESAGFFKCWDLGTLLCGYENQRHEQFSSAQPVCAYRKGSWGDLILFRKAADFSDMDKPSMGKIQFDFTRYINKPDFKRAVYQLSKGIWTLFSSHFNARLSCALAMFSAAAWNRTLSTSLVLYYSVYIVQHKCMSCLGMKLRVSNSPNGWNPTLSPGKRFNTRNGRCLPKWTKTLKS